MRLIIIALCAFVFSSRGILAQMDPEILVKSLANKMLEVDKYSADILIRIDVEFVNIEERKAKVFYEKPGKFEIKSTGILLLPKKGIEMEYLQLFNSDFAAIDENTENLEGINTRLVKLIPMGSDLDIVLAQLWIDEENLRLIKMKTYTKSSGLYTIDFTYLQNPFDLPASIRVEFDVRNMSLPTTMTGDLEDISKKLDSKGVTKGAVIIEYSNYEVN
jgi:outer membrane lipoprotein-sorting protein